MEGHEILNNMAKVRAPEGFEGQVLSRLPAVRRQRVRRATTRLAFAGTAALAVASFLIFRPAPVERQAALTFAERQALTATPGGGGSRLPSAERNVALPVYETMDYASEFRNAPSQPAPRPVTVYILEQVSEVPSPEIIY